MKTPGVLLPGRARGFYIFMLKKEAYTGLSLIYGPLFFVPDKLTKTGEIKDSSSAGRVVWCLKRGLDCSRYESRRKTPCVDLIHNSNFLVILHYDVGKYVYQKYLTVCYGHKHGTCSRITLPGNVGGTFGNARYLLLTFSYVHLLKVLVS